MRTRLTVGTASATARLYDNATARDFASLLPVSITVHDLGGREKAGTLPREIVGGQGQNDYRAGQIGYWPPSHDLALYYHEDGFSIPKPGNRDDWRNRLRTRHHHRRQRQRHADDHGRGLTEHQKGALTVNPTYDFSGRVAFITGASSGMGLATARAFAEAGAAVTLADVDDQALHAAETQLRDEGHRVLAAHCDVADEAQVAAAVRATVEAFGSLDMAYNNAGIQSPMTDAADESAEMFDRVNAINLRGIWASMKHELAQMRIQGSGAIVNCSSLGGLVGLPGRTAYHASKHGVIGLTRSAALEYAPRGIRVNAICPGTIETPMVTHMIESGDLDPDQAAADQPIGRLGTAEEMAAAVLWLCSPAASFVVGVALPVDGGYTAR